VCVCAHTGSEAQNCSNALLVYLCVQAP